MFTSSQHRQARTTELRSAPAGCCHDGCEHSKKLRESTLRTRQANGCPKEQKNGQQWAWRRRTSSTTDWGRLLAPSTLKVWISG